MGDVVGVVDNKEPALARFLPRGKRAGWAELPKAHCCSIAGRWGARVSMLHSASPNQHGAGIRCLYDSQNQLIEGRQERYWRSSRQASPYRGKHSQPWHLLAEAGIVVACK